MYNILLSPFFAADTCRKTFFGLKPWYEYLKLDGHCNIVNFTLFPSGDIKSSVPLILLAIIDDLLRIAALVAVVFIIVGAINLITSQGNPEDASRAQGTIINALLGLAIAIVAVAFVTYIGHKLT